MKKSIVFFIIMLIISCDYSKNQEKNTCFNETVIKDSINIYFIPLKSYNYPRQEDILYNEYGLIWKHNVGSKHDSLLKGYYDSIIYKKFKLTEIDLIKTIKKKSDSLKQILEINQSYNGSYTYVDTFPKCIISKDSLSKMFTYKTDLLKEKNKIILNFIVDTNGIISQVHIRKSMGNIFDSIAKSKLEGAKVWEPAWYNSKKVKFYYQTWHFDFIPDKRYSSPLP